MACSANVVVELTSITMTLKPRRLSKGKSPTKVLLGTPVTQMIIFNEGMLLLRSNHFRNINSSLENSKALVTTSPKKQHYRLELCYEFNLQYRPLSTYYTQKLVYKTRTNCPKSLSTSSRTLETITHQETVT